MAYLHHVLLGGSLTTAKRLVFCGGQWFGENVQAVYTFPQDKQARRPRVVGGSNPFTFTHHTGELGRTSCRS